MSILKTGWNILIGFMFVVLLIGLVASPAEAAGSISGIVVRSSDSAVLESVTVSAYDTNWNFKASGITDSSGNYSVVGLAAGNYHLHTSNTLGYIDLWHNTGAGGSRRGQSTAVAVIDSIDTSNVNFSLFSGAGSISGTVINGTTLAAIPNVTVTALEVSDNPPSYIAWVSTDSAGNYSIPGLAPGVYYLKATNSLGYLVKFYDNAEFSYTASTVSVTGGLDTSGSNFSLTLGGSISGRVTRDSDGAGIAGVRMYVSRNIDFNEILALAPFYTDSQGYYTVTGLTAGYYLVLTSGAAALGYSEEYFDNTFVHSPIAVPVALETDTPNIDFSLAVAGTISGRITRDYDGAGLASTVYAYDVNWYQMGWSFPNASGNYTITGLPPGFYYVQAGSSGYVTEYYNNATSRGAAVAVAVTQGTDTPGINVSLAAAPAASGGSISGTVTPESGPLTQLSGTKICIYATDWNYVKDTTINLTTGAYSVTNLAPGDYYVGTCFGSYVNEYYDNAVSPGSASTVAVTSGMNTAGINFIVSSTSGGSISGNIRRDSDGTGIYNAQARVYDSSWNLLKSAATDGMGNFSVAGLLPGSYYVASYRVRGYTDEYYSNVTSREAAVAVAVTQGANTPAINFALSAGWAISGTVGSELGGALPGGQVIVYNNALEQVAAITVDYAGNYYMDGFAPGTYYLKTANNDGYIEEFYRNTSSPGASTPLIIYPDPLADPLSKSFYLGKAEPALTDVDEDGESDIMVWRPGSGIWYVLFSDDAGSYGSVQWGLPSDVPVAANYDGDGDPDASVWRPGSGVWYIMGEHGSYTATQWGLETDKPVPGDYDGDDKADIAVFRPDAGTWFILPSNSPGDYQGIQWGLATDVPVPKDYDGDGKVDIAVWRPSSGIWYILPSESPGTYIATQWGMVSDIPVPGDYDGDGKADIAVWRPGSGIWYILPSNSPGTYYGTAWGVVSDTPATGDYDGDGKLDIAVWRSETGTWFVLPSGNPGHYTSTSWGTPGDLPISAATGILQAIP
jgi:hypothetical protein